ncbi:DNA sulfur modification protein DndB [Variovorax saccharolyticus]|uniref:DNA sulfur modification protein DndB n=1 Tax=Variovorax saccharolyticus TaxID=3053516 RepID=UPI0025787077|nr:DNA sulfur modification protein DndB [Variovorax sp. J31P216]MDM0025734.1 DNA sulfur modification protein DndB [Variovorax sp. J31P216]
MTDLNLDEDFSPLDGASEIICDFSDALRYHETTFGISQSNSQVGVYSLSLNAKQLEEEFVIFEQIPNVESWPISKLIQRELNHERAKRICDDYLLKDNSLKYFPPLTAVLIPTDDIHQPREHYEHPVSEEDVALRVKYAHLKWEDLTIEQNVRGLSLIKRGSGAAGALVWDKRKLSAVIIDGQHRFKALLLARQKNKSYDGCAVSVNIINLFELTKSTKQSPTALARDLFVTINSTPVEVDEARLVLMDDKESFATFTQVLVDDSDKNEGPAVRPELIDWRCEQGKHDTVLALTGVLTLWSVLSFSICKGRAMASIEDRLNEATVRKWCDSMNSWLDADRCLEEKLGPSETLNARLEEATASATSNESEEESPFLFSYSKSAVDVLRNEFKRRYAPAFRLVFAKLSPYASFQSVATGSKAFDQKSKLHSYLRSFRARRAELYREPGTSSAVDKYKQQLGQLTSNRVPYTVMGQKAVFYSLFNGYLSDLDDELSNEELIRSTTEKFINEFNDCFDLLQTSNSVGNDFFNTKFRPEYKKGAIPINGKVCQDFWKGIIVKVNDELDYGNPATKILASIFLDLLNYDVKEEFRFTPRADIVRRHRRILVLSGVQDDEAEEVAEDLVIAKEGIVQKLLRA